MECKILAGLNASLLVSDCSSTGGSDSEEDVGGDKIEDAAKATGSQTAAAAAQTNR